MSNRSLTKMSDPELKTYTRKNKAKPFKPLKQRSLNKCHYQKYQTIYFCKIEKRMSKGEISNATVSLNGETLNINIRRRQIYEKLIKDLVSIPISIVQLFGKRDISKEISEAAPIFHQLEHFDIPPQTLCYVIGEGTLPKISYLIARLNPTWIVISCDPEMTQVSYTLPPNLQLHAKFDYDLDVNDQYQFENVVIIGVHSHNEMRDFLNRITRPNVLLLALYCCVTIKIPEIPCSPSEQRNQRCFGENLAKTPEVKCITYPEIFTGKNDLFIYHRGVKTKSYHTPHINLTYSMKLNIQHKPSKSQTIRTPFYQLFVSETNKYVNCVFRHFFKSQSFNLLFRNMDMYNIPNSLLSGLSLTDIVKLSMYLYMIVPHREEDLSLPTRPHVIYFNLNNASPNTPELIILNRMRECISYFPNWEIVQTYEDLTKSTKYPKIYAGSNLTTYSDEIFYLLEARDTQSKQFPYFDVFTNQLCHINHAGTFSHTLEYFM